MLSTLHLRDLTNTIMSKLKEKSFKIFVVNAFTSDSFSGNPAAYIPLTEWLPDATLQALAEQNNLSETVFTVPEKNGDNYHIRWFTPTIEVKLCGHATLACAYVLFNVYGHLGSCLLYTSPSPRDRTRSRMPSSA